MISSSSSSGESILIRLSLLLLLSFYGAGLSACQASAQELDQVVRTIDGDTVLLAKLGRARLIGVDTPELARSQEPADFYGVEASRFTQLQLDGKQVHLEFDQEREDVHGRKLVYVRLPTGEFFNALLIEQGYALAYTAFDFRYRLEFLRLEDQARRNRAGLWQHWLPEQGALFYHGNSQSRVYHSQACEHFNCGNCTERLESREDAERNGFRPHWECVRPW